MTGNLVPNNPSQQRVPAGTSDGAQWSSEGGAGGGDGSGRNDPRILTDASPNNDWHPGAQYAQNRTRGGPILINGRMVTPTPGQAARLAVAEVRATDAINRVREIDPNWRPSPSAYEKSKVSFAPVRRTPCRHMRDFLNFNATGLDRAPLLATRFPRGALDAILRRTVVSTRLSPPNSIIVIADHRSGRVPTVIPASRIAATGACIIVGCLAEMDGKTEIVMGKAPEIDPGYRPSFDGVLETPSHVVCVWTVEWEKVLETPVPTTSTRVRVWGNHSTEPDRIIVGLESAT